MLDAFTVLHEYAFSKKLTSQPPTASSETTPNDRIITIIQSAGSRVRVLSEVRSSCCRSSPGKVLSSAATIGSRQSDNIARYIPRQSSVCPNTVSDMTPVASKGATVELSP
ncbi:hypothetical protein D3C78_1599250 [compost metagenome]